MLDMSSIGTGSPSSCAFEQPSPYGSRGTPVTAFCSAACNPSRNWLREGSREIFFFRGLFLGLAGTREGARTSLLLGRRSPGKTG